MRRLTTEEFISKASKIHNNKYDYSQTIYTKNTEKVIIICKEHGGFISLAANHLRGKGCPKCANKIRNVKKKITLEIFLSRLLKYTIINMIIS